MEVKMLEEVRLDLLEGVTLVVWLPGWQPRCQMFQISKAQIMVSGWQYPVYGTARAKRIFGPVNWADWNDQFGVAELVIQKIRSLVERPIAGLINQAYFPPQLARKRKNFRAYELNTPVVQAVGRLDNVLPLL